MEEKTSKGFSITDKTISLLPKTLFEFIPYACIIN